MKIHVYALGIVQTNCYILEGKTSLLIFDPGDNSEFIKEKITNLNKPVAAILLTHAHFDHIGAIDDIVNLYSVDVYVHSVEKTWLKDSEKNGSAKLKTYQLPEVIQHTIPKVITEGKHQIGEFEFEVLHTPGHSPGSLTFVFEECAIVGDTLFKEGIGRTDLYKGDLETLMDSIEDKLFNLPTDIIIYPGHGPSTTIADEQMNNPFINGFN